MKVSKNLEIQIKKLLEQGKVISAVHLVQRESGLGLKMSKEIVDKYIEEWS